MFKLIDLKNAVGEAVSAVDEARKGKSSKLEASMSAVATMFKSEEGRRYRESLGKVTLMAGQSASMFKEFAGTIQTWEIVSNFANLKAYNHPEVETYLGMLYSGLSLMESNEEDIRAAFVSKHS